MSVCMEESKFLPKFGRLWLHFQQLAHWGTGHISRKFFYLEKKVKANNQLCSFHTRWHLIINNFLKAGNTYEWPHHWIVHLPNHFQRHSTIHINGTGKGLKYIPHGLWYFNVFLFFFIFFRSSELFAIKKRQGWEGERRGGDKEKRLLYLH